MLTFALFKKLLSSDSVNVVYWLQLNLLNIYLLLFVLCFYVCYCFCCCWCWWWWVSGRCHVVYLFLSIRDLVFVLLMLLGDRCLPTCCELICGLGFYHLISLMRCYLLFCLSCYLLVCLFLVTMFRAKHWSLRLWWHCCYFV